MISTHPRTAPRSAPDRHSVVLDAAKVMFENGEQTTRVQSIAEGLASRLGVPGRLRASWGHLDLISEDARVRSVDAVPETVNLDRVQQVRKAVLLAEAGGADVRGLDRRLSAARTAPASNVALFTAAAGIGAAALVWLWGLSDPASVVIVAVAAALGALLRRALGRLGVGPVAQTFAAALLGGIAGAAAPALGVSDFQQLTAIGPALVLVPGPQLMNAGLDISGGRLTLGIARLLFALVTIFAISAGILLGLALAGLELPVYSASPTLPLYVDALCASVAAGAYAIFFSMPLKYLPIPVLVGASAHGLHSALISEFGMNTALASGIGALLAGAVLIPVSQRLRIPFAGIGFASIVSMVPSVYIHRAVSGLLQLQQSTGRVPTQNLDYVVYDGITAVLITLALVLGLVLPFHVYRTVYRWSRGRA